MRVFTEVLKVRRKSVHKSIYNNREYTFYNVTLDDGKYTNDFNVTEEVYNDLEEDKSYSFECGFIPKFKDNPARFWIDSISKL